MDWGDDKLILDHPMLGKNVAISRQLTVKEVFKWAGELRATVVVAHDVYECEIELPLSAIDECV